MIGVWRAESDAQLILPWFITDIINAVDMCTSAGDLQHMVRRDL